MCTVSGSLSRWQALALGLVVLGSLILGGIGLFVLGSRVWSGRNDLHVQATFPEIKGIEVGTRVRLHGIDAGEVEFISAPDRPGEPVLIRLRVKEEYRHLVRANSTVHILSEGMLGGKVVEIRTPTRQSVSAEPVPPAENGAVLVGDAGKEISDLLVELGETLNGVRNGEGTLGKLVKDETLYEDLRGFIRTGKETVAQGKGAIHEIQRGAEGLKRLPVIGSYIEDEVKILVRPTMKRFDRIFAETELFEPGRAVLTDKGKERLDDLAAWAEELKVKGSEIVVVSYAEMNQDANVAKNITQQQSLVVLEYLKTQHKIHKLGWFTSRKTTSLGMGINRLPHDEKKSAPSARIEVIVFVPQT